MKSSTCSVVRCDECAAGSDAGLGGAGEVEDPVLRALYSIYEADAYRRLDLSAKEEIAHRLCLVVPELLDVESKPQYTLDSQPKDPCSVLPFEVILQIFGYLRYEDICGAYRVCRRWRHIAQDPAVWLGLYRAQGWSLNEEFVGLLNRYLRRRAGVEEFAYEEVTGADGEMSKDEALEQQVGDIGYPIILSSSSSTINQTTSISDPYISSNSPSPESQDTSEPRRYYINWRYIYEQRAMIEDYWEGGFGWVTSYLSSSNAELTENADAQNANFYWARPPQSWWYNNPQSASLAAVPFQQSRHGWQARVFYADGRASDHEVPIAPSDALVEDNQASSRSAFIYKLQYDKNLIVSASKDRTVKIWNLHSGVLIATLRGHTRSVLCVQFDARKNIIVSGAMDGQIIIWDMRTLRAVDRIEANDGGVMDLAFDDRYIYSAGRDAKVHIYSFQEPRVLVRTLEGHTGVINCMCVKDNTIVTGSADHTVKVWDVDTGRCVHTVRGHSRGVASIDFDGRLVASGGSSRSVHIYDIVTGKSETLPNVHDDIVRTLQFSSDSSRLITGSHDGKIKIWKRADDNCKRGGSRWMLRMSFMIPESIGSLNIFHLRFDHRRIVASAGLNTIICIGLAKGVRGMEQLDGFFSA
ncbi:WD40-repeat-containing domain protein, partial [Myxozyma melibiosi]